MTSSAPSLRARAAAELELRRRSRLLPFDAWLREVSPTWRWDWPHLEFMRANLGRVRRGELSRLWMFCPPRHGKTEQNTVRFAAYALECDPTKRIIVWAYNQTLAEKFSRKIRRIVADRVPLNKEKQAADEWETGSGGGIRAAGVGVGITGMGADLILIDDPVKNRQEAESQAYRDRVYESYTDDLLTRLEPGGAICGTMTRWHEDDLAGRILASEEGPDWEVLNLPAIAEEGDPLGREPGEALCPDRYPVEVLDQRKRAMGARNFSALFQGRPQPASGNKFQRAWFRYFRVEGQGDAEVYRLLDGAGQTVRVVRARDCRRFGTIDLAFSLKKSADYSVLEYWAVTPQSDLLLIDLERGRWEEPDLIRRAEAGAHRHKLAYYSVESNAAQLGVVQVMRRAGLAVRAINSMVDKVARASTAIVRCEAGQIYWADRAPWLGEFEAELLSFPSGAHDDQVDPLSMAAEDVFWGGGAAEPDDDREAREAAEARAEAERRAAEHFDLDNPIWWGGNE
jgi:predicted phage terminase large subunit-like protein